MILPLDLPEILDLVSQSLTQFDVLSLLRVCRKFHHVLKPRLYRSITIHSQFTQFDLEYFQCVTTYIRTKSNILALLDHPECFPLIHSFHVLRLPVEFIEFERCLRQTFLSRDTYFAQTLRSFVCHHPLGLVVVSDLAHATSLKHLDLRINVYGKSYSGTEPLAFNSLHSVSIGPVKTNDQLRSLLLLVNPEHIKELEVSGQAKKLQLKDLVRELRQNSGLVSCLNRFESVRSLSMNNLTFQAAENMPLPKPLSQPECIERLSLANVNEVSLSQYSILDSLLQSGMPKLQYLRLSLRQGPRDSVAGFVLSMAPNTLKELDLELRYNTLKDKSLDSLVCEYTQAIHRQAKSLTKLSFAVFTEKNLVDMEEHLDSFQFQYLFLTTEFPLLQSLRTEMHFQDLYNAKLPFFQKCPRLEYLWILGSNAVDKHWAMGNTYPGIFDSWLRIQHLPKKLVSDSPDCHLKYIKVDQCLFEVKPDELTPRDCIDDWFESATRV